MVVKYEKKRDRKKKKWPDLLHNKDKKKKDKPDYSKTSDKSKITKAKEENKT